MSDALKPLVLVVDDELCKFAGCSPSPSRPTGYRILPAVTGQEGLVLAAQHRPNLVNPHLGLPDWSGQGNFAAPARVEQHAGDHSVRAG